jgi:hypothetical protein
LPRDTALPTTNTSGARSTWGVVAFDQADPLLLELGAHRRIDIGVAAGDRVAGRAREQRDAAHEGAADAEDVDVHAKDVEIFLLNEKIDFRHSTPRTDRAEAVLTLSAGDATVNLVIYPRDQERVSWRTRDGRPRERARLDAVRRLLAEASAGSR